MKVVDVNTLFKKAEQAFADGRVDAARATLHQITQLTGDDPAVLHLLALVEKKAGDLAASRAAFGRAAALAPADREINNNYANLLSRLGHGEEALAYYDRAIDAAPGYHDARMNRAVLLQRLGRFEEALEDLDKVAAARPSDPKVQSARGSALRSLDRLDEAADAFSAALRSDPHRVVALHGRARVAIERGEDAAPDLYRRALVRDPGNLELQLGLAEALEAQGDPSGRDLLACMVAREPAWLEGQAALARMRWEDGEGAAFTRELERALAANPCNRDMWLAYAAALGAADMAARAADAAERARAAAGDDPTFILLEAAHASEAGQMDRAERLYAILPPEWPGRAVHEVRHRMRCGDYDRAAALAHRTLAAEPWNIGAWAVLGLLWRLDDDPRAKWLLTKPFIVSVRQLDLTDEELEAITARLRSLHRTRAHPIGQSLRGGTQTRGRLFQRQEPEIARLRDAVVTAVGNFWDNLPSHDSSHPLLRHRYANPRLAGSWSVRLTDGGFHISHIHPQGILSSACYFVVPEPQAPQEGFLEVGGPPHGLDIPLSPLAVIEPKPGVMTLFPSYMFHGTRSFASGERLTAAFDVVPS